MLAVLIGMAAALRAIDTMMVWASGVPRGVLVCASLDDAEGRTGLRLVGVRSLLGDFTVQDGGIRATVRPVAAISVGLRAVQPPVQHLTVFRSAGDEIPERLRPPLPAFHQIKVTLDTGVVAELRAESLPDGSVRQDMEWVDARGRTALRFDGHTVDLLSVARRLARGAR